MKQRLIINHYYHQDSMTSGGWFYRYQIDNKFRTSGSFHESMLKKYEKIFDIDWKEIALSRLEKRDPLFRVNLGD